MIHFTFLYLGIVAFLLVMLVIVDKFVTPHLSPDNKYLKWWRKHIIKEDPDHL